MAKLTADQYARRRESASRHAEDQKQITTLTEDQHDALATVGRLRHELHCMEPDTLYHAGSSENDTWSRVCGNDETGEDGDMNELLAEVGLPQISGIAIGIMPSDDDIAEMDSEYLADECGYEGDDEDELHTAYYEYGLTQAAKLQESINTKIEQYLRSIDEEHGTQYCPTGALRV